MLSFTMDTAGVTKNTTEELTHTFKTQFVKNIYV